MESIAMALLGTILGSIGGCVLYILVMIPVGLTVFAIELTIKKCLGTHTSKEETHA